MPRKVPDEIQKMAARLEPSTGGGRGKRSELFRWIYDRADSFQTMLNEHQPSWESVAKVFADTKVRDGSGKLPSAERVRKAWLDVRQAKGWATKKAQAQSNAVVPAPAAVPSSSIHSLTERMPMPPAAQPAGRPAEPSAQPRTRERITLRPPVPLAEGEPAQNDGSRLPAALRPERK